MARLDFAILANGASGPPDNLVYILGGGIDTVQAAGLPAPLVATLVLRFLRNRTEADRPQDIEVLFQDQDGNPIVVRDPAGNPVTIQPIKAQLPPAVVPANLPPHWDLATHAFVPIIGLPLPKEGIYSIEILLNGQHVRSVPLRVALTTRPG